MATSLQRRVEALEQADGGNRCPRCSGTTVVLVNGNLWSVTKEGQKLTPEEAEAFAGEEEDGRCPVCGQGRQEIKAGREAPSR